jgi:hypothetical protein
MYESIMETNAKKWTTKNPSLQLVVSDENARSELKQLRYTLRHKSKILKTQRLIVEKAERDITNLIKRKHKLERQLIPITYITSQSTPKRSKKKYTLDNLIEVAKAGKLLELIQSEGL